MATGAFSGVLWQLRSKADCVARTDDELLDRFRNERDEAAFAAIVRRHGPMVFGVCRRTLRNDADAEDAFQATFLVLARKAHEVRPSGRVGHWLYGVAFNTSRKARVMNRRRTARELRAGELRPQCAASVERSHMNEFLDVELSRLPELYRSAVVACDLEGESLKQAAERLDCPVGTVASRLARGRELLRRNLLRRGIAMSALLVPGIASARVPARLALSTTQTVAGVVPASTPVLALTQGVIQAMFLSKIKFVFAAIVAAGVLVAGIGNGPSLVLADPDKPVKPVGDPAKPVKPGADPVKPGEKPAKPEKPANPDVKKGAGFVGALKSVDAEKGTITVTATKGDTSIDRTFPIAKDAKVSIDGKEGKLADLKAGIRVGVKLGDDKTTAVAIGTEGATFIGNLKEVAADRKSVKVAVKIQVEKGAEPKIEEKTLKVVEDTKVVVSGQKNATVADLKTGSSVSVQMSADGERALVISSPAKGGGGEGPTVTGELKGVDASKKTVKVAVTFFAIKGDKNSAKTEEKTIQVSDDARIVVDGQKGATLADLKAGSTVAIQLSPKTELAMVIFSPAKGGGDPGVKKPGTPDPVKPVKPVKPGTTDPVKPVKPGAADPVKPVKPGADPVKPVKPGAADPVKPVKP